MGATEEMGVVFGFISIITLCAGFVVYLKNRDKRPGPVHLDSQPVTKTSSYEARQRSQINIHGDQIGVRFNSWRKPIALSGPRENLMELLEKLGIANLDISPREWEKATDVVDIVLRMLFSEVAKLTSQYRLRIEKFIRQGSAREGLKVCTADEFDSLLLFTVDGLQYEVQNETDTIGRINPENGKLRVTHPISQLEQCYPKLYSKNVFNYQDGNIYLNSRMLHERVFTAVIDRAMENVKYLIDTSPHRYRLKMTRARNPPSIQLGLSFVLSDDDFDITDDLRNIYRNYRDQVPTNIFVYESYPSLIRYNLDVDIVPALLIQNDTVPDPVKFGDYMDCPRYAVFKWARNARCAVQDDIVEPDTIWRMDSSGYEKHVLDVAHGFKEQRYILTALRVLKAVFLREKRKYPPIQTVTVIRSYFLKQLAFYCILYYTVLHKYPLSGVLEALTILLEFLQICLEEQRLPHFFHTNSWLPYMFPDYITSTDSVRFDVFHAISKDALLQAQIGLRRRIIPMLSEFTCDLNPLAYEILDKFREFISEEGYI